MASMAAAASPVPAATPLEQRQWRRQAQRSYRLALTAIKEARSRYDTAHSAGLQHATVLSNALLTQQYLPGMPLGALKGMRGLLEASARKLVLRQQQALQRLHAALRDVEAAAADMAAALEDVRSCGGAASPSGGGDGDGGDALDSKAISKNPDGFQQRMSIFNSINLSTAVDMLSELLGMYQKDCELKQQLVGAMKGIALQAAEAAAAGKGAGGGGGAGGPDEGKARLTVVLSSWLARPYLEEARVEHLLLVLTEDMAGF